MATSVLEKRASHIRGITVTAIASIAGVAAGIFSQLLASGAADPIAVIILIAIIIVQFPLLKFSGIVESFSKKDQLFIGFMTFSLWFVTWGILLTTDATIPV